MGFNGTQPRNAKGAPLAGAWRTDDQRRGAGVLEQPSWEEMTLEQRQVQITDRIQAVLSERGIDDWGVRFNTAYTVIGVANYRTRQITIANPLLMESESESLDTAMHEAAHVIAGPSAKHGPEWKRVALELGASPKSSTKSVRLERPKRSKSVTMHGRVFTFHEGVTSFERSGTKFTVDRVNRKNLIAANAQGQRYQFPITSVTNTIVRNEEKQVNEQLDLEMEKVSAKLGRQEALRILHGLSSDTSGSRIGACVRALGANAKHRGLDPIQTSDDDANAQVAELVAAHDWRGTVERRKVPGSDRTIESITLHNSAGKPLGLIRDAVQGRATTTAEAITSAVLDVDKFDRYGKDPSAWEAAGEPVGNDFRLREVTARSVRETFSPQELAEYRRAADMSSDNRRRLR